MDASQHDVSANGQAAWPARVLEDPAIAPFLLTGENLRAYGRLRYELFVERDGKAYPHADHAHRLLIEPVDQVSLHFGVVKDGKCLIGVRVTWGMDAELDPQLLAVRAKYPALGHNTLVINSRLAAAAAGQPFLPALFRQVFRAVIMSHARYGLVAARQELVPLFQRFGYRPSWDLIHDRIAGPLVPMCLDGVDAEHLRATRSPYLKPFQKLIGEFTKEPAQ